MRILLIDEEIITPWEVQFTDHIFEETERAIMATLRIGYSIAEIWGESKVAIDKCVFLDYKEHKVWEAEQLAMIMEVLENASQKI